MPSKLLEEAIIDAEALKEAALRSAQEAVLEQYAPEVKKAIQVILEQEMMPDSEEDDPLAGLNTDSIPDLGGAPGDTDMGDAGAGMGSMEQDSGVEPSNAAQKLPMAATEGEKLCACPDEDEEIEINFDELERQMSKDASDENTPDTMPEQNPQDQINLKLSEEVEIDEDLIRELVEGDLDGELDLEETKSTDSEELEEGGKGSLSAQHKGLDYGDRTDDKWDGPKNTQDAKRTSNKFNRKDAKQDIKKQQSELKENLGFSQNTSLIKENKDLLQVRKELFEENKKIKQTIRNLTQRLEETNLSNAKLLYTNQALTSNSLNERQKQKIVEAISKAESVDDVKLIYETLQHSVGSGNNKKPEPKSLNEAVGNKGGLRFPRREPEVNSNPVYTRMQKIAGIKK